MSPAQAFLVVSGIVVVAILVAFGLASLWLLRGGRQRTLTFPRRADHRGGIAEHEEHYWQ